MKRSRAFARLLGVLFVASTVAVPQAAAAAGCTYQRQDLPVPAGAGHVSTEGGSTDNSRIVGLVEQQGYGRGVQWVNGALEQLPAPTSAWDHVIPTAVNNTGVVAGYLRNDRDVQLRYQAFRYENGAYELLQTERGTQSKAVAVNDAGDVLGLVWTGRWETSGAVVLWPRDGARKTIAAGTPIGIDNAGKIVVAGRTATVVIDANTGARTELPGQSTYVKFDNDRVLRGAFNPDDNTNRITEWSLDGVQLAVYEGGGMPFGKNSGGTFYGTYRSPTTGADFPSVWSGGVRTEVATDHLPFSTVYGDVTDDGTLIGTYSVNNGIARPALWVCA